MTAFLPILAHAFGKRYDFPVPLWLFVSFLLVLLTAVRPATANGPQLGDRPRVRTAPVRSLFAWIVVAGPAVIGWIGSQPVGENMLPTAFWLPWIIAMVGYTLTSLRLLAPPAVQEGTSAASVSSAGAHSARSTPVTLVRQASHGR